MIFRDGSIGIVGTRDGWVIFYDLNSLSITKYERVSNRKPVNIALTSVSGRYIMMASTSICVYGPDGE